MTQNVRKRCVQHTYTFRSQLIYFHFPVSQEAHLPDKNFRTYMYLHNLSARNTKVVATKNNINSVRTDFAFWPGKIRISHFIRHCSWARLVERRKMPRLRWYGCVDTIVVLQNYVHIVYGLKIIINHVLISTVQTEMYALHCYIIFQ